MKTTVPARALLIVISAPSGAGKTTVCQQLLASSPGLTRAITCTTRAPRGEEKHGVDYYFLDAATFMNGVQAGDFLEHATVYGNRYGTRRSEVIEKLRQGRDVLLNVDVQGAASIRKCAETDPELKSALVSVFLTPSGFDVLEQRLRNRGTDAEDVIKKRLAVARQEISQYPHFDYLLISSTIPEDLRRMQVIIEAEKLKSTRVPPPKIQPQP